MLLWAFLSHYTACGLLCPTSSSLGILDPFSDFTFLWAFTNSLRLPWPNYHIFHLQGSWIFHQPFTFSLHYFGPAVAHSHFFTSHNAHGFTISFSGLLLGPFASLKIHLFILWAYNPLFLPFGLNGSSNHPLTLLYPYFWASSLLLGLKMSINKYLVKIKEKIVVRERIKNFVVWLDGLRL